MTWRTSGLSVGNLRSPSLRTVCIGCNLCRPQETYVNVGCSAGVPG